MRLISRLLLIFSCFVLIPACGTSGSGDDDDGGDTTISCSTGGGSATCFQNNLMIVDQDGNEVELVSIFQGLPAEDTTTGNAPAITSTTPSTDTFQNPGSVRSLEIGWTDPLGSQPAFCIQLCPASASVCTTLSHRCTRSVPDGLVMGTWRTFLGYDAQPTGDAGTTEELRVSVTPISAPNGADPIAIFEDLIDAGGDISDEITPDEVSVGEAMDMTHTLVAPTDSDSSGGDTGTGDTGGDDSGGTGSGGDGDACTASSQCAGDCFSTRNCVDGISCDCSGSSTSGVCASLTCGTAGSACGNGSGCCVGLSCTNNVCVNSGSCL